jgi:hypothetical protein
MLFRLWCEVANDVSAGHTLFEFIRHMDFISHPRGVAECGCERVVVKITVEGLFIVIAKEPKKDETRCVNPSFGD